MHIGVDFGTTNTVVALSDEAGNTRALQFPTASGLESAFRSILCYVGEDADSLHASTKVHGTSTAANGTSTAVHGTSTTVNGTSTAANGTSTAANGTSTAVNGTSTAVHCGPAAIAAFFEYGEEARLIQSVKTFLSNKSFSKSTIHGREYTLEQIVADFLRGLCAAGEWPAGVAARNNGPVTVGRPVRFAGAEEDEAGDLLAEKRLRKAFASAGFATIDFALEPQAAAYFFVRRLKAPATVLVADFGGGTSDFSVVRFTPGAPGDPRTGATRPLAHAGVGVAGDTLDYRIIDNVVAPLFGKGSRFRPADKMLEVPKWIYFEFEHWHRLSFLKRPAVLSELRQIELSSDSPQKIAWLRLFLEHELGFHLYQAVNQCKAALSTAESAPLVFRHPPIEFACTVHREDFERWIERDVAAIESACSAALREARLTEQDISVVFMTGGTSFVPAIRKRFEARFGVEKIVAGDEFVSVASGLALLARERAPQR